MNIFCQAQAVIYIATNLRLWFLLPRISISYMFFLFPPSYTISAFYRDLWVSTAQQLWGCPQWWGPHAPIFRPGISRNPKYFWRRLISNSYWYLSTFSRDLWVSTAQQLWRCPQWWGPHAPIFRPGISRNPKYFWRKLISHSYGYLSTF